MAMGRAGPPLRLLLRPRSPASPAHGDSRSSGGDRQGGLQQEQFNSQITYANPFTRMYIALSISALLERPWLLLKVSTLSFPFMIYIFSHLNNDSRGKMYLQLV